MREGWRACLLGPGSPDWFSLEDDPRAVRIKVGHARATWRVTIDDRTVFAKVIHQAGFVARLWRGAFGHAPSLALRAFTGVATSAEREWYASREAQRRGVCVVRSLAVGVSGVAPTAKAMGRALRTVLLSAGLTDAVALTDAWERNVERGPAHKRRLAATSLIEAVARLFAVAHERGFVHGDAHPNNILVRASSSGEFEAVYLDVHSARLERRAASLRRSARCLAQLDQYFQRRATRAQRLRFLRQYLARRPSMIASSSRRSARRELLRMLMPAKVAHASRLARERDRRLLRNGPCFSTLSLGGGWKATVVLRLERRHVFPEAEVPDRAEVDWRTILEPLVETAADMRAAGMSFNHQGLGVEVRRTGNFFARLMATLRGSPHRRVFERCHKQRHRDIRNELMLACAEHRRAGLVDATILIRPRRDPEPRALARAVSQDPRGC